MDSVDMFCVGDDRHRVALLEDFLVQAGQSVELHTRPPTEPSDPCLVACTSRSLRTPWITALFDADVSVVALRLDDTPLPGPCLRAINLQSWPARTADRKVADLVDWLIRQGNGGADDPLREGAGGGSTGGARRTAGGPTSDTRRALLVLLLLLGGGALLFSLAPERRPGRDEPAVDEAETMTTAPGVDGASAAVDARADSGPIGDLVPSAPAASPAAGPDGAAGALAAGGDAPARDRASRHSAADGAAPATVRGSVPTTAGAGEEREDADARTVAGTEGVSAGLSPGQAAMAQPVSAPRAVADDALAHLCAARSLAAARAWADALSWKQRRRARSEPCVERLLARPGYAPLRALLTRP